MRVLSFYIVYIFMKSNAHVKNLMIREYCDQNGLSGEHIVLSKYLLERFLGRIDSITTSNNTMQRKQLYILTI